MNLQKREFPKAVLFRPPIMIYPTFPPVYILGACRTAIGKLDGQFTNIAASTLGGTAITFALIQAGCKVEDVNEVIMGQTLTSGQGQNPARQAANGADIPPYVPAHCVNMHFGSGLKAVKLGMNSIANGDTDLVVCGGQDSYSQSHFSAPVRSKRGPHVNLKENIFSEVFVEPYSNNHIAAIAEQLARFYKISRVEQDLYSLHSHLKAKVACENGYFDRELAPLFLLSSPSPNLDHENIIPDVSVEGLKSYPPCFEKVGAEVGSVTLGNLSQFGDGASAIVLCSSRYLNEEHFRIAAKIVAFAELSEQTSSGNITICSVIKRVIADAHWSPTIVDLYEIVEDSAAQVVLIIQKLKIKRIKINTCGGSIALGHTLGDSSSRILVSLVHSLKRKRLKRGVAASSAGAGMAVAIAIELY